MIGNSLMKTVAILVLLSCLMERTGAKPSAMKFLKFKCNYKCMTDFDMCVSLITTMPMYVICYRAQGICKRSCKRDFGKKTKRSVGDYHAPETTVSPTLRHAKKLAHQKVHK
uniref:Cnidarian restricted protein n=1 Tax=Clytia hemisphaerica TaxID=252671 RepID=A0A7M5VGA2_9CNID|eukprot:TCONS_00001292-protein